MPETKDPFYVGYLPLPAALRPSVKLFAGLGILLAAGLAFALAPRQQDPGPGVWDLDTPVAIEGHLAVDPYPVIYVEDPAYADALRAVLLVSEFKFSATKRAQPLAGQRVRATGTFVNRQGRGLFELASTDNALTSLGASSALPSTQDLGSHTLQGEIVDSKCYLGVMKPGFGKTHRACAVRCLSGGIPPGFLIRGPDGEPTYSLLVGTGNQPIQQAILDFVAEPVELPGRLERRGDLLVYTVDPAAIRRL